MKWSVYLKRKWLIQQIVTSVRQEYGFAVFDKRMQWRKVECKGVRVTSSLEYCIMMCMIHISPNIIRVM